ncbi:hypothetical protein ACHAXA_006972 [Cyclostephanos tholiformis]|uniref:Uncharacterized protein n=1 Tax=Cyclostephanos tholiformis TaxID=382380 RepID=A0ABD3RXI9_9STRA
MTKNRFILLITFSFYALGSPFQLPTNGIRHDLPTMRPPPVTAMTSSDSTDDDAPPSSDFDELIKDETLLRINFSFDDDDGSSALTAVQRYTRSFPFAAILPVQPFTYLPVTLPDGNQALKVSFLRKKTAEKGSEDGGILFSSCLVSEEDCDDDGMLENYVKRIQLTAWRIKIGQTVSKAFSEKQIILAFVKGLIEGKGAEILKGGGNVEVDSVFHLWM